MFGALKPGFQSLATLKLVVNVVGELQTDKNSCGMNPGQKATGQKATGQKATKNTTLGQKATRTKCHRTKGHHAGFSLEESC